MGRKKLGYREDQKKKDYIYMRGGRMRRKTVGGWMGGGEGGGEGNKGF